MSRRLIVVAEKIRAADLWPGDIFSTEGPEYWNDLHHHEGVGETVFMRNQAPAFLVRDPETTVYRLRIHRPAVKGQLEVGTLEGEVVINHPDLDPDHNGVGHIVFSPQQARDLATSLIRHAIEAEAHIALNAGAGGNA
jgi:hypothetical protein